VELLTAMPNHWSSRIAGSRIAWLITVLAFNRRVVIYGLRIHPSNAIMQPYGALPSIIMAEIHNGGDTQGGSSEFTQNPGSYIICFNGTQPKQAKVSIEGCNVSDNPGPYSTESVGFGEAIVCRNSTTLIDYCIIKGNKALLVTPKLISGCNAGLDFGSSDVALNDTLIEANEAFYAPAIFVGQDSTVMMNRCTIAGNRALRVLNNGIHIDGDMAGVIIGTGSKVTMNDVSIHNNLAEGERAAISNSEILSIKMSGYTRTSLTIIQPSSTPERGK